MDFFERQNHARQLTKILLCYFLPAVVLIVFAVYSLVVGIVVCCSRPPHEFWNWRILLVVSMATLGFIVCAALDKMRELSEGGRALAILLGGKLINPTTTDFHEVQLRDVVQEMAIASGTSAPEIYVLENEQSINAFVAGNEAGDAVLGVTEGTLRLLTRDELQAVVAHEFSHLLNGDMKLNFSLIGLLSGILGIALLGKTFIRLAVNDDDDAGILCSLSTDSRAAIPLFIVGLILMVIGSLGYFFGRLIQSAICRQREALADASAVQFTRNPIALAGALKKVGGLASGSRLRAINAEQAGHLFFGNVLPDPWLGFLNTHPPLVARIRALDSSFDGNFPFVKSWTARVRAGEVPGETPPPEPPKSPDVARQIQLATLLNVRGGKPVPLQYAVDLKASFPDEISAAARETYGACALVYALLLSTEDGARAQQLTEIPSIVEASLVQETQKFFAPIAQLSHGQKLALLNLTLPTLRQLSCQQFQEFSKAVQLLIESDQQVSLFEFVLQKILFRNLPRFAPAHRAIVQYYALPPVYADCSVLFSALARVGSADEQTVADALALGVAQLKAPEQKIPLVGLEGCGLTQIDAALDHLTQASMPIKKQVLTACACVVAADGVVQEAEAELLRAIAEALDCPLPPFVGELAPVP